MSEAKTYVRNIKHILSMCFILFALSPCVVKESVFGLENVEYAKPPNKAKTTHPANSCEYSQNTGRYTSVVKQTKINKKIEPVVFLNYQHTENHIKKKYFKYSQTTLGNNPPKYILYKRLKLELA